MSLFDRIAEKISPAWAANRERDKAWGDYYRQARREVQRMDFASYEGAVSTRLDDTWEPSFSQSGVRHLAKDSLGQMRDRARKLDRKNVLASSILDRSTENIVSTGFTLQAKTSNEDWNKTTEEWWRKYESLCDVRGMSSLAEVEGLLYRSTERDGDVGVNLLPDGRIQPIEGDMIESPLANPDEKKIIEGVQINKAGRPVAFWLKGVSAPIAAKDFIYLPRLKRTSQVRGEPVFSSIFQLFDQIDGYVEASVVAARMAACFGLILKEPRGVHTSLPSVTDTSGIARPEQALEPGTIRRLGPLDDVFQIKPEQPHQNMPDFIAVLARFVGLNLGLPLELVLLDFSRTTYSSSRTSLNQARRTFEKSQRWLVDRFLTRLYQWRISKAIKDGDLQDPGEDEMGPMAWRHEWIPPGWPWIDPNKETESTLAQLDAGLTTLQIEAARRGHWWIDLLEQSAKEREKKIELGLPLSRSSKTKVDEPVDDDEQKDDDDA